MKEGKEKKGGNKKAENLGKRGRRESRGIRTQDDGEEEGKETEEERRGQEGSGRGREEETGREEKRVRQVVTSDRRKKKR